MNILIINDFAHINGGAGQVALTSAIALSMEGYNVILFAAVGPIMSDLLDANVRVVLTDQYDILNDPNRFRAATQGIWNFKAQKKIESVLKTLDPDNTIVHIHSWTKALSSSVVRCVIRSRFKLVCSLHDYFTACPNGGFFDYNKCEICHSVPLSLNCICKNCDARSYTQKNWRVLRQVIQQKIGLIPCGIKYYISISDYSLALLEDFLPKNARIFRVKNPIDITLSGKVDVSKNNDFIFVGRLSQEKGVILLAKACSQLGLKPVFVGAGELDQTIKEICPDAVLTGWLSRSSLYKRLVRSRVLILPSLWHETQGLVVAEAAALGIPAIVPDTCAAREMVEDGQTGLWFHGGDLDDLIQKIQIMLNSRLVEKLGSNAYDKYWTTPPTIKNHVDQLKKCYNEILLS